MLILLDCRPLQTAGPDSEKSRLILSAAATLSASDGIEWLVVADHRYRKGQFPAFPGRLIIRRALPGRAGWQWWYDRQLPRIATQMGVDRAWLTGGITGRTRVPICLWMPERANPNATNPNATNPNATNPAAPNHGKNATSPGFAALYKNRLKSSLERAAEVVCYSQRDRIWLEGIGPMGKTKIRVLSAIPDETIRILTASQKDSFKAHFTHGKEFFLADLTGCGEQDIVNLLKAFSLFKKRQRSQMRLILSGNTTETPKAMAEQLKTYKYREDVDWDEKAPAGAAYAVLLPVEGTSLGTALLNRWKAEVPVIAAGGGLFEEMAQGAILSAAPGDPAALAAQLMRIYKEEDLREELTRKGFERLKVYSRENFLDVLRVITEIATC